MKVKDKDLTRMVEIIYFTITDAENHGDQESVKWLTRAADLLDELLIEGVITK